MSTTDSDTPMRVLLVEDDEACRLMLVTLLSAEGLKVTPAPAAEEALEILKSEEFDILVTDIQLPGIDGITLLRNIREVHSSLPVVVITGNGSVDSAIKALQLGAQDYLMKPFGDCQKLVLSIKNAVKQHRLAEHNRILQEQLMQSEETFRILFENANDAVFLHTVDSQGNLAKFDKVNDTACRLLGYNRDELQNKTLSDITSEEHRSNLIKRLLSIREISTDNHIETVLTSKDGTHIHVEIKSHPITLRNKQQILSRARDISYQRKMEKLLTNAVETERQRLGQDLHDLLCQDLASITMLTSMLKDQPDGEVINGLAKKSVSFVKSLCAGLFPVEIEEEGLISSLDLLARNQSNIMNVDCTFEHEGDNHAADNTAALHIYRIAQESVTNAIKHSKAAEIRIKLSGNNGSGLLFVEDNGCGIPEMIDTSTGMGINIMKYRANMIGAALQISSGENGGTRITCSW